MDRQELSKKLSDIADIGIVNAKHDVNVIREAAQKLTDNDFRTLLNIFNHRHGMIGHYEVLEDDGKYSIALHDHDQSIVLVFDEKGMLIG